MNRSTWLPALLASLTWLTAVALPARAADDLVISVAATFSGPRAFLGQAVKDGAQLAIDEVNAAGGVDGRRLKMELVDDQGEVSVGVANAHALVKQGQAMAVIGHRVSDIARAAGTVYGEGGVPMITASASAPEVTRGNPWAFRVIVGTDDQGRALAEYARHVLGQREVRIVADGSPFGQSLADAFAAAAKAQGLAIAGTWKVPAQGDDRKSRVLEAARAAAAKGDGALLLGTGEDVAVEFLTGLRDAGDRAPILAGQALGNARFNDHFKELPGERARRGFYTEGLHVAAVALVETGGEAAQRYYKRFREAFKREPDGLSAAYYDATMLAIQGLRETHARGGDAAGRKALRDWLAGFNEPNKPIIGTTGRMYLDQDRSAVKSVPMGRFTAGRLLAAPIQLDLIVKPDGVPNFERNLAAGQIVKSGDRYLSKVNVVYTGIDVVSIPDINQRTGEYEADMFVWLRSRGPVPTEELEFTNATSPIALEKPIWVRKSGDMTVATYRVRGSFKTDFNFARYPFDHQVLPIVLRHATQTVSTFILATDSLGMTLKDRTFDEVALDRLKSSFASTTWLPVGSLLYQTVFKSNSTLGEPDLMAADAGLEYSEIIASVEVKRDIASYLFKNLLPLGLILVVLYMSNFVPGDQMSTRVSIAITTLLTSMVLYQRLSGDLPSIGYLTLMDDFFFVVFAIAIGQVVLAVAGYLAHKAERERLVKVLHRVGFAILPGMLALAGAALWVAG